MLFVWGLIVSTAFTCQSFEPSSNSAEEDRSKAKKAVGDFRKDLMTFVKRSKAKGDPRQRFGAVVDLCHLHWQIVKDHRFESNLQLKGFRAIAADRLSKCQREIEIEMKRYKRQVERVAKTEKSKVRIEKGLSGGDELPVLPSETRLREMAWIQDMQLLTQISGGPINLWQYTGGQFGPNGICDYGPDLVRLIENTISPDSWRTNGGNAVIHYYRPLRILVVSASSQVHDDLTDFLNQLR